MKDTRVKPHRLRVALYLRLSEDKRKGTDAEGENVDSQRKRGHALADEIGGTVVLEFNDNDRSAKKPRSRAEYARMLESAKRAEFDVLIVLDHDRLYRHPVDLGDLAEAFRPTGITVRWIRSGGFPLDLSTPAGLLNAEIMASVGKFEITQKALRQMDMNAERALNGQMHRGKIPYGWNKDRLTLNTAEAEAVREIYKRVLAGEALQPICRDLNERGIPAPDGGAWANQNIRAVFMRPTNAGIVTYHGKTLDIEAKWEAIVSRDDYYAARALLEDPDRNTSKAQHKRYMLSGIPVCDSCDAVMRFASGVSKRKGKTYKSRYYKCPVCFRSINGASLEEYVRDEFLALKAVRVETSKPADIGPVLSALEAQRKGLAAQLSTASRDERLGILDKMDETDAEIENAKSSTPPLEYVHKSTADLWAEAETVAQQNTLMRASIRSLRVRPGVRGTLTPPKARTALRWAVLIDPEEVENIPGVIRVIQQSI